MAIYCLSLININKLYCILEKGLASLDLDPNNKKACEGYGDILLKLNQHSKAIAYIRRGAGLIQFTEKAVKII